MDFYSVEFFSFISVVAIAFFATPFKFRWIILLAASYYFYGSFGAKYIAIIVLCTLTTYLIALGIQHYPDKAKKKLLLVVSIWLNVSLLFLFKYFDFFNHSLSTLLVSRGVPYTGHVLNLIIPVGISFYVFQLISYSVDVYRGETPAEKHIGIFALYVSFFPKLLAGPIERAKQLLPQFYQNTNLDGQRITDGLKLIAWGLFKKLVIADRLASFVNIVYADPSSYQGISLTIAAVFYSFQIYCDFSGYTDIAIGIAQIFGFRLTDNFDRPYSATSVADFWRRWHISLSYWLRDYLYIPLGGNRVKIYRLYFNYLFVFFICGLWHGANWTFIVWGILHGLYLCIGRFSLETRKNLAIKIGLNKAPLFHKGLRILVTFALITFAWIFFRANTLTDACYIITHLHVGWERVFDSEALSSMMFPGKSTMDFIIAIAALIFLGIVHKLEKHSTMRTMFGNRPAWLRFSIYYIIVLGILLFSMPDAENFIYFQF